jgi:hypothetical protein
MLTTDAGALGISKEDSMRRSVVLTIAAMLVATAAVPADAAPMKDVLAACDRTAGCEYSIIKDGSVSGCSSKQSGVCFTCDAPGTKNAQCHSTSARTLPSGKPGKDAVLDTLKASPGKPAGASPRGTTDLTVKTSGGTTKAKETSAAGPPKAGLLDGGASASKTSGSSKTKTQTTTDPLKTTTTTR